MTDYSTKKLGDIKPNTIGIIGLCLSSIGAVISALSFTAGDGRQTSAISGIDYHVALISDVGFKLGFYLLILGFVLQIVEKRYAAKAENIRADLLPAIFLISLALYVLGINIVTRFLFL